ncbi:MAG: DUF4349 domain-containing protein [Christensenellaceae bacterium]|jgi:hypothetical protein|nr:DUF4349 domain-containing protein [Christensenellaceae bacterium]
MKHKHLLCLALALVLLLTVAACSAKAPMTSESQAARAPSNGAYDYSSSYDMGGQMEAPAPAATAGSGVYESAAKAKNTSDELYGGHKIIANYSITMTTDQFDAHYAQLMQRVDALGGYVQNSTINGSKPTTYYDSGRYAYFVFRIPAVKAAEFVEFVGGTGTITYSNSTAQDVTLDYYDNETRVAVLRTQLERLQNILVTTNKLADIIELEQEIANVTFQIEEKTTQLRHYDDLIGYATVSIDMSEESLVAGPAAKDTMGTRIVKGFTSNLSGLLAFGENFVVWFVSSLPALILLALLYVVIILIVRRSKRLKAAKAAEEKAQLSDENK